TQGTLILDERQREQQFCTALDQHVATEGQRILVRVGLATELVPIANNLVITVVYRSGTRRGRSDSARRTARTQAAVHEAAHRIEATGKVVLVERQLGGGAVGVAITQLGVEAQGVVVVDRLEQLAAVVDLEE